MEELGKIKLFFVRIRPKYLIFYFNISYFINKDYIVDNLYSTYNSG